MAAKKDMKLSIKADEVMYTNVSKSKNYNSAGVGIKKGDNEYLSISYEWSGDSVPDFVMDLMGFMQANKEEVAASIEDHKEELATLKGIHKEKSEEEDEG